MKATTIVLLIALLLGMTAAVWDLPAAPIDPRDPDPVPVTELGVVLDDGCPFGEAAEPEDS